MDTLPEDSSRQGSGREAAPEGRDAAGVGVRAASDGGVDGIKPLIAEIRARMAELVARELALREREQDLERQYRQFQKEARVAARQEWVESQERLRQRSDELDVQAVELAARGNRLKELEERVGEREAALEKTGQAVGEQVERLRQRSEAHRKLRQNDQQLLRQRITVVRQREKELERRLLLAREDIVGQRNELEQKRAALQARVTALKASAKELQMRKAGLEREVAGLKERARELSARDAELDAERAEVHDQRYTLDEASRTLESQRIELQRQQRDLAKRWCVRQEQRHELGRQTEELDGRRRLLDEQEAAQEQRRQRLENYEEQLRGRAATLEDEEQRLAQFEEELNERRGSVDALVARTREVLQEAEQRDADAAVLREQAEARDAESRQRQLALELETEELRRQHGALERAQEELDGARAAREAEFARVRADLAQQAGEVQRAQQAVLAQPGRWWLRSGILAAAAGWAAGLLWLGVERPNYRATMELRVTAPAALRAESTFVHEQRLRDPTVIAEVLADEGRVQVWRTAREVGQARIIPDPEGGTVCLSLDGPEAAALSSLVSALGNSYATLAADWTEAPQAAATATRLRSERQELEPKLDELRDAQNQRHERLASLAELAARDAVRARVAELRTAYAEQGEALAAARVRLADAEAAPTARGSVLPADYENALLADEMYQADLKEFQGTAGEYRSELTVAMLLVVDPLHNLRTMLGAFADTLAEQRDLQPPPAVAAVLEQCSDEVTAFNEKIKSFEPDWKAAIDAVQALEPARDLVALVKQQNHSDKAVRKLCQEAGGFQEGLRARLDELSANTDGGTRAVVVAALVRGELGELGAAIAELQKAAENIDLSANFRLDALDRQLRGLEARLERRRTSVRQILQFEADEQARRVQAERVSELRTSVQELDQRRERLIEELSDQLDELRRLDAEVAQRLELEAAGQGAAQDIAALEQRIGSIDEQLAAAREGGRTASVEAGQVQVATIGGGHRQRQAACIGGGVFAVAYAMCVLMLVRNPWRRRAEWETALREGSAGSAGEEGPGDAAGT